MTWVIERDGCGVAHLTNTVGIFSGEGIELRAGDDCSAEEFTLYLLSLEVQLNSGFELDDEAMADALKVWQPKIEQVTGSMSAEIKPDE